MKINLYRLLQKLPPELQPIMRVCEGKKVYFFTPQQLEEIRDRKHEKDFGTGGGHPLSGNWSPTENTMKPRIM